MRLAENSLPKRKDERYEGLAFAPMDETVRQTLGRSAGKALLLSDDGSLSAFSVSPRAISVIFDGDALPLFAMPDGVSRVLVSGGRDALWAARYFAGIRGIPCTVFPKTASLDGVFEAQGEVLLGGERTSFPLPVGETVCDMERISPTLAEGFSRLLLTRLAFCEAEALTAFGIPRRAVTADLPDGAEEIVAENARARCAEREGGYGGEGTILAALLREEPCPSWSAFLLLSSLYAAFFEKGKPRRFATPDYHARAERAGVEFSAIRIPSREEYAARALILERVRARFVRAFSVYLSERAQFYARVSRWSAQPLPEKGGNRELLERLPECGGGLSAIIRDFGLMEWHDDKRRTLKRN